MLGVINSGYLNMSGLFSSFLMFLFFLILFFNKSHSIVNMEKYKHEKSKQHLVEDALN